MFTTLKGSLFAITDELLLLYRHRVGLSASVSESGERTRTRPSLRSSKHWICWRSCTGSAIAPPLRGDGERCARSHARARRIRRPSRRPTYFGERRKSCPAARSYELSGGISFRGFVEELEARAEKEDTTEAPALEDDSDGVRLLTVHSAKGLEFPVVILADLTANIAAREPDHHVDAVRRLCATRLLRWRTASFTNQWNSFANTPKACE